MQWVRQVLVFMPETMDSCMEPRLRPTTQEDSWNQIYQSGRFMEPMYRVVVRFKRSDVCNVPKELECSSVVDCFSDMCEALIQSLLPSEHLVSGCSHLYLLIMNIYIFKLVFGNIHTGSCCF